MKFTNGFKTAAVNWSGLAKHVGELGGAAKKGLQAAGSETVGQSLKLKGLSHLGTAAKNSGGVQKMLTTSQGRKNLAEGLGKAAPSLAAGTAYAAGAKKLYDNTVSGDQGQQYGY